MAEQGRRRLWYPNSLPVTQAQVAWAGGKPGDEVEPKPRPERTKRKKKRLKLSDLTTIEHIACLEAMWLMAEEMDADTKDSRPGPGRKRLHSTYEGLLYTVVVMVEGYRSAERTLGDTKTWRRMRRAVRKHYRNNPQRRMSKRPINRDQHYRFSQQHLTHEVIDKLQAILTGVCLKAIDRLGGLDPKAGSIAHPDTTQMFTGDGTDIRVPHLSLPHTCRYHDPDDPQHRCDNESNPHYALRNKTNARAYTAVKVLWRSPNPRERILVDFDLRTPGKSDGTVFVDRIKNLKTRHPKELEHLRATTYDMAVKGKQCERLGQLGLIHVGKVPRQNGQVAVRNLGDHQFKLATAGSVKHPQFVRLVVWAMDGPPVIDLIDGHGRTRYLALVRKRVQLRPRSDGCTIYVDWAVPDKDHAPKHLRGAVTTVRHTLTSEELEEDPNRLTAALRIIPESDEDYDKLFGLREDPESSNAHLKRILRGRARSADSRKMRTCMLAYQVLLLVRALDARRQTDPTFDMSGFFGGVTPSDRASPRK